MIRVTLSQLAGILGGELKGNDLSLDAVTTDTRKLTPGCLFVALKGERFDAHDFAEQAKEGGAGALLVSRPLAVDLPQVIVQDTVWPSANWLRGFARRFRRAWWH